MSTPLSPINSLVSALRSPEDNARADAFHQAGPLGAPAIPALAALMHDPDTETARAAKRALWRILHHAARPQAPRERADVVQALHAGIPDAPVPVARELIWMLSVVGRRESVPVLARLLAHAELREDARCALQRIPGPRSANALRRAMATADDDFAPALADALRALGEQVDTPPTRKRTPTRATSVGQIA